MTSAVQKLKSAGVKAIMLTVGPKQTASAVGVAAANGLNIPFLGNNPVYAPLLLKTAAGPALIANLYVSASSLPLSADKPAAKKVLAAFRKKYPGEPSNAGVTYGYGVAKIYEQTLKAACAKKDLSREGIESAFRTLTKVTTDGLIAPLDYSKPGQIPARQTLIARPNMATLDIDGYKIVDELQLGRTATQGAVLSGAVPFVAPAYPHEQAYGEQCGQAAGHRERQGGAAVPGREGRRERRGETDVRAGVEDR